MRKNVEISTCTFACKTAKMPFCPRFVHETFFSMSMTVNKMCMNIHEYSQKRFENSCCRGIHLPSCSDVPVQREGYILVAEPFLDHLRRDAGFNQHRCVSVPQVMELELLTELPVAGTPECSSTVVLTGRLRHHEVTAPETIRRYFRLLQHMQLER